MAKSKVRQFLFLFVFIVLSLESYSGEIKLQDKLSGASLGSIRSIKIGRKIFIPIEEFAQALSIPTTKDLNTKKINLFYKKNKITFTAYNPFVHLNKFKFQMTTDVRFPNGDFYVPLQDMIKGFELTGINTLSFNAKLLILYVIMRPPNIVKISTVSNGDTLQLVVQTTKKFQRKDIDTIQDKEWIYLNINGGVIDVSKSWKRPNGPAIFEFIPSQIDMNKARLALHVAPNVSLDNIKVRPDAHEIVATLISNKIASSAVFAELLKEREKWKIDTIIIDPGHGGKDAGCSAPGPILEKNIALSIAKKVRDELKTRTDAKVILTRDRDYFVPLKGRTKKANQAGGKLFISIHVDANRVKSLHGHTVYFLGPAKTDEARNVAQFENSVIKFEDSQNDYTGLSDASFILAANAQNSYNKESQELAAMINNQLEIECGSQSHGVRQAGFYVLYGASMPNVLVETGFITNASDRQKLSSQSYQHSLAKAIADGVMQFKRRYESTTL